MKPFPRVASSLVVSSLVVIMVSSVFSMSWAAAVPFWVSIGPDGEPGADGNGYTSTGRVEALSFDPGDPNVLYAGSAAGGIWRSSDRGGTWTPLGDHKGLPNLGASAIAVVSGGTVYLGVGDLHYGTNHAVPTSSGGGVFKSTDAGGHWHPTGETPGCDELSGQSARILVDPSNSDIVWIAAEDGLYRSLNGGECWRRLLAANVSDIAMKPDDSTTLFVGGPSVPGTIEKITNGHDASPIFNAVGAIPVNEASPRVLFAVTAADSAKIYAALALGNHADILRSDNGGDSWITGSQSLCSSQCDFGAAIAASPQLNRAGFSGDPIV